MSEMRRVTAICNGTAIDHIPSGHALQVLEDFKEDEEEKINEITENIVKQLPTLISKKIDLFSSKVNQDLNGI